MIKSTAYEAPTESTRDPSMARAQLCAVPEAKGDVAVARDDKPLLLYIYLLMGWFTHIKI